ncbi:MAG: sialidase family protein, partial [Bryobacteraceae bacterium]
VPSSAREGLHALAADASGHAAAVWLDLRSTGTRLYAAFSNDAGATWSRNSPVYESPDGTICQCCHPSLLALGGGEFAVMFRNVKGGDRDMYLLRIRNGGVVSPPTKLGNGSWHITACPMDGGGMVRSGSRTLTAWRRGEDIFLASPHESETKIGTGKDVALAAHGAKVFAVWTERGSIESWTSGKTRIVSKAGAFPSVVSLSDGSALAAWEEGGVIATRRLD